MKTVGNLLDILFVCSKINCPTFIIVVTMTINFYLDSKSNRKGEKALYCRATGIKNKSVYINTGVTLDPKDWNKTRQLVRKSHSDYTELNNYLSLLVSKVRKEYYRLWQDPNTTFDNFKQNFKDIVKNPSQDDDEFFRIFDLYLDSNRSKFSKKYIKNFTTLKNHLVTFERDKKFKLSFDSLDMNFLDRFLDYSFDDLGLTNNTVSTMLKLLRTFLNWAVERNYTDNKEYKKFKIKEYDPEIIFLTYDELMRLYNLDLSDDRALDKVRDFFCLGCFTGQRFSDIANIKSDDIRDNHWHVRTQKNRELISVYVTEKACTILDKYFSNGLPFPSKSNQMMNLHLKELCKMAEISEPIKRVRYRGSEKIEIVKPKYEFIGTHTARKTFVTLSLEMGMRPETVMSITGHNDYRTMKKYLAVTGKMKENEMKKVWDS